MRQTAGNTDLIDYMEACPRFKDREIAKYERLGYCRYADTICLLQENPCNRFKRYKRIQRMKQADTLHLVLKSKWFEMIAKGEKKEEYREIKQYYLSRFCTAEWKSIYPLATTKVEDAKDALSLFPRKYKYVVFQEGYSHNASTMRFRIKSISIGYGNRNIGAPIEPCFIIKLGGRVYE